MGRTRLYLMDEIGWQLRERADDRPVHRVRLNAFAIDVHEVTNGEYATFVASPAAKIEPPFHWGDRTPPAGKERHPVYNVTWFDAQAYCQAQGGRLPTEAEWERAARGDARDLDYPWGNDYEPEPPVTAATTSSGGTTAEPAAPAPPAAGRSARSRSNRRAHSGSSTGPVAVGSFAPNSLGLYDVSGNLWEWTADWYDLHYYSVSPVENPTGPSTGRYKVIRGGSWADNETRLGTLYYRNYTAPDTAQPTVGFRCVVPVR